MKVPFLFVSVVPVARWRRAHHADQLLQGKSGWSRRGVALSRNTKVTNSRDSAGALQLVALAKKRSTRAKSKPSNGGGGFETASRRKPASRETEPEQPRARVAPESEPTLSESAFEAASTEPGQEMIEVEALDTLGNGHARDGITDTTALEASPGALETSDTDERHTLHVQEARSEKAVQELLSGVSLRSNQELTKVMHALQLSDADLVEKRAPMNYSFRRLLAFAEETLLRDQDLEQLAEARKASSDTSVYAPLQQIALQGLSKTVVASVAANRHYFDNRFFYGLSALRLAAEHRGPSTERDRLTLLTFRAQQSIRIIDAPLMRALNDAERAVQALLEELLKPPAEGIESVLDSALKDASSANLVAIWIVVYAASAAWEMRRLQDPRAVKQNVVRALLEIRRFLRTQDNYRERLPAEMHWLSRVALERDRNGEERLLREPPDPTETTARVGGLAASLAQASSNAYIALSRMFRYLYDSLRRIHFEAGDLLEDAEDILALPDVQLPKPQVESRFQRITLKSIESA